MLDLTQNTDDNYLWAKTNLEVLQTSQVNTGEVLGLEAMFKLAISNHQVALKTCLAQLIEQLLYVGAYPEKLTEKKQSQIAQLRVNLETQLDECPSLENEVKWIANKCFWMLTSEEEREALGVEECPFSLDELLDFEYFPNRD